MIHLYPIGFSQASTAEIITQILEDFLGEGKILLIPQAVDRAAFAEQYLASLHESTAILLLLGPQTGFWNPGITAADWRNRLNNAPEKEQIFVAVEEKGQILTEAQLERFLDQSIDFAVDYIIRPDSRERDTYLVYNALNACFPNPASAEERIQLALDQQNSFLDLSRCSLQQLPPSFIKLAPSLERLNLEGNELKYIPTELSLCEHLEVLDLRNNPLGRGVGLALLKNLRVLNLSNTSLQDFPNEVIECFQLEQLDLSRNHLSNISGGIGSLQRLQRLNLIGNRLLELPEQLAEMPSLQDIMLMDNTLRTPPIEVALRGMASIQAYFDDLTYGREEQKGQNWFFAAIVDQYADPTQTNRPAALEDAQALAQLLQDKYAYTPTSLLFNAQATEQQVLAAIQTLERRCGPRDNLIFYFSVNTEQPADQESRLCLYDRSLSFSQITRPLNAFQAKHILVIIDEYFYTPLLESERNVRGREESYSSRWVLYGQQPDTTTRFSKNLIQLLQANKREITIREIAYSLPNTAANPLSLRGDEGGSFPLLPVQETTPPRPDQGDNQTALNFKNQVKTKIAKAEIDQVIETLQNALTGQAKNDLILLASRWSNLQKQKLRGTIDPQSEQVETNQILVSLLYFLDDLEPGAFIPAAIGAISPAQEVASPTTVQITDLIQRIAELRTRITLSSSTRERRSLQIELNAALLNLENRQAAIGTGSTSQTQLTQELLAETNAWTAAYEENALAGFEAFLNLYPKSTYAREAGQKISELRRQNQEDAIVEDLRQNPSASKFNVYFKDFPTGKLRFQVQALKADVERKEAVLWTKAQAENTIAAYEQYRQESKLKYHESEAHTLIEQLRNTQHTLVNEAKLIVVGNGRVGKTSLTKVLVGDEPFDPQENSTHGIRIKKWTTAIPNGQKLILNIWDFGGQERYHNTHSFFLTKRALYLLVWDKETQKDAQTNTNLPDPEAQNFEYEYWLNVIKLKGGNSPVLMVQNKIERDKKQLQLEDSIEQFDNILDIEAVSAATGENVEDLRKNILKQYQSAEPLHNLISFTMPPNWRNVQELLEKRGKTEAYIPIDVYHELCAEEKIADADALATYLNDIGSVLYFPDGDRLSEILILNPIWATEVIYKIMNGLVKASGGYFTYEDLKTTPVADNKVYNAEGFSFKDNTEKRIFLELMLRFDICFELKKAEDLPPNKKTYLVPQYLSTKKHPAVQQWPKQGLRRSGYRYTFLPRSVIARVIARLGKMSSAENWWRDGLIIEDQGTKAKIEADYSRDCIRIEVQGKEMKELEARIHKEHFNEINLQMQASAVRFCPHCDTMIDEKWIQERPDQSIDRFDCLNPTCRKGITISSLYPTEMETKPRIFISYAREDANYKEQLDKSLRQLEWEGELEIWDDSQLIGGDQWYKVIKRELTEANIIIFLLSVDFLTSKFIRKEEISTAFERYAKEEVMIIPVIVRDCLWQSSPLEQFTILPVDAKPVNTYSNADEAWLQITKKIRETLVKQFNWGKKP